MTVESSAADDEVKGLVLLIPAIRAGFLLATILSGVAGAYFVLLLVASATAGTLGPAQIVLSVLYLTVTIGAAVGCLVLTVMNHSARAVARARLVTRWTLVLVVASMVLTFMTAGIRPFALVYLYQLGCLVAYQLLTDPDLRVGKELREGVVTDPAAERKGYVRLNFFNVFWVFMVASVLGLIIEVVFRAITTGTFEDRAGVLWGPFSPIYGFGAVLMTVALNRFYDKPKVLIFAVSGVIGAAFEFFVSYFMENAFGIRAWDYSGTFLNIGGRTNFAFFCAWGLLGLTWIKLLLPDVLRLVGMIALSLRTAVTVATTLFMLGNGTVTLVALDCWYGRGAGVPQTSAVQIYAAQNFDDAYMAARFQTMQLDPARAARIGLPLNR